MVKSLEVSVWVIHIYPNNVCLESNRHHWPPFLTNKNPSWLVEVSKFQKGSPWLFWTEDRLWNENGRDGVDKKEYFWLKSPLFLCYYNQHTPWRCVWLHIWPRPCPDDGYKGVNLLPYFVVGIDLHREKGKDIPMMNVKL